VNRGAETEYDCAWSSAVGSVYLDAALHPTLLGMSPDGRHMLLEWAGRGLERCRTDADGVAVNHTALLMERVRWEVDQRDVGAMHNDILTACGVENGGGGGAAENKGENNNSEGPVGLDMCFPRGVQRRGDGGSDGGDGSPHDARRRGRDRTGCATWALQPIDILRALGGERVLQVGVPPPLQRVDGGGYDVVVDLFDDGVAGLILTEREEEMESLKYSILAENVSLVVGKLNPNNIPYLLDRYWDHDTPTLAVIESVGSECAIADKVIRTMHPSAVTLEINPTLGVSSDTMTTSHAPSLNIVDGVGGCSLAAAVATVEPLGYQLLQLDWTHATFVLKSQAGLFTPQPSFTASLWLQVGFLARPERLRCLGLWNGVGTHPNAERWLRDDLQLMDEHAKSVRDRLRESNVGADLDSTHRMSQ